MKSTDPHADPDAATQLWQLWQLWRAGQQPDVDAFLAQTGALSAQETAAVLRVDQRERWQRGEHILAERYLERHPLVRTDAEAAVDLIFNEFLLRDRLGETPDRDAFLRRFPEYAKVLRAQIELHHALQAPTQSAANESPERARPESRTPMALVLGSGVSSTQELQALLRRRLLFLCVVFCGYCVGRLPLVMPFSAGFIAASTMALLSGGFAVLLVWQKTLSLRLLRAIEITLFATVTLSGMGLNGWFFSAGWFATIAIHDWFGMVATTRLLTWIWVAQIIVYGIVIPNTGRRCAGVVAAMAAPAIALNLTCALMQSDVELRLRIFFCVGFVVDIGLGVVIAVFGAHRLESLRSAAAEARKLGQYQLKQRLGAGGMGEVYLAEHGLLKRPCAVKLIRPDRLADPVSLQRFEHEVQLTAGLTHPNTVEIFDFGHATNGTFYYVMEYLAGPNLEELTAAEGPLPPGRAVHLLRQICGSLAEAHAAGLIHRDIKPTNVIACKRGGRCDVAKLLDFGLARQLENDPKLTQEGVIAGTPAYMSPEQAAGTRLDARSDIYSLGALAYFLLTGQPPFVRPTAVQTLAAHLSEPIVAPSNLQSHVPADLEAIVLRCLAKTPEQRFPSVDALEQALAGCVCAAEWSWPQSAACWRAECERWVNPCAVAGTTLD